MNPHPTKAQSDAGANAPPSATGTGGLPSSETQPRLAGNPGDGTQSFLSPPEGTNELGRLGPYRILGELGRGGMGAVYRAEDPTLRRQVAIKVMAPHLASDPRARARFIREARAQAQVEHEHVAPVFQAGEANGVAFITMPLLKGRALSDALADELRLSLSEVLRVGREIAEGLAAAHEKGLVHRDIKPANIWLEGSKSRVRILDFGLARAAESADALTGAGAVVGTPAYMSPEQAIGKPVDHRADLWSLGVVLYQMATGEKPFTGPNPMVVIYAITHTEPPAVQSLAPGIPPALAELIGRLLAKDPAARPPSAEAVADELAAIERALSVPSSPSAPVAIPVVASTDPLAELGAVSEQEETRPHRGRASRRQSPWLIPAITIAGMLLAGAVLAVLVLQRDKSKPPEGDKPQAQPPAAQHPPVPHPQKPPAGPPKAPAIPADADADRAAAKALGDRAQLGLKMRDGSNVMVKPGQTLPPEPFSLHEIDFLTGRLPDNYAADVFLPAVTGLKSLAMIRMAFAQLKLTGEQLQQMAGMPFADTLFHLEAGIELTPSAVDSLARFKQLLFFRCRLTQADDALLARLGELKALRYLTLTDWGANERITAKGWRTVARLPLDSLSLYQSTRPFADGFRELTAPGGPKTLVIDNCQIGDADLAALAAASTDLMQLRFLNVPTVTDEGLKSLAKVRSLSQVALFNTGVTAAGLRALAEARPDLTIQSDKGNFEPKKP